MSLNLEKDQLSKDKENLTRELDGKTKECNQLSETVGNLTSQLSAMSQHAESAVSDKNQAVGTFRTKLEQVEAERDQYRTYGDNAMRELAKRNEEIAALEAKVCLLIVIITSC